MKVFVLRDEDGILRPSAFICVADKYGEESAKQYVTSKYGKETISKGATIVKAELTELK
jgi:hypothetical protein